MKKVYIPALLLIFFSCSIALSQDCEETLNKATAEFEAGRFYGLPSLLKPCLDNGFSNEQKVRAYSLLTQAYLILDDPIAAEESYLKLLKADPEYLATEEKDPIDIVYLSKKFTATPIFTPHGRAGINATWPSIIYGINTDAYSEVTRKSILKPGYQIGGGFDWNLTDNWSLCAEINFAHKAFKRNVRNVSGDDDITVVEKQNWIDIPMYVKYAKSYGKIRPFGYVGFSFNLLITNNASINNIDRTPTFGNVQSSIEGPDVKLTQKSNFFNRSLVIGAGVKYKIKKDFIYFDIRYMPGLSNIINEEKNFYDGQVLDDIATRYRWTNDLYRINSVLLSVGYIRPLYDPRKIKSNFFTKLLGRKKK